MINSDDYFYPVDGLKYNKDQLLGFFRSLGNNPFSPIRDNDSLRYTGDLSSHPAIQQITSQFMVKAHSSASFLAVKAKNHSRIHIDIDGRAAAINIPLQGNFKKYPLEYVSGAILGSSAAIETCKDLKVLCSVNTTQPFLLRTDSYHGLWNFGDEDMIWLSFSFTHPNNFERIKTLLKTGILLKK